MEKTREDCDTLIVSVSTPYDKDKKPDDPIWSVIGRVPGLPDTKGNTTNGDNTERIGQV